MTSPLLSLTWTDHVTGRRGFLVVDRLVRGVASGGLRMRAGCTAGEIAGLARATSVKQALRYDPALRYVPPGGAGGGIDCDPGDPEAYGLLVRFLRAVRPYVACCWTAGEELGLDRATLDRAAAEAGLESPVQAVHPLLDDVTRARRRLADALAAEVDGIGLAELSGGRGVAEAALTALDRAGRPYAGTRVALQGFGAAGGATARFLAKAGLTVVAVADLKGTIVNPDGLDVAALLDARDAQGGVDRGALRPRDRELPPDAWLSADAEVLVPAAGPYAVDVPQQARITASLVVEAADAAVVAEAETLLAARGVTVLPDVVVNSATDAWWWSTLFGDTGPDADEALAHVRRSTRTLVDGVQDRAAAGSVTPREAAHAVARERLADVSERFGWYRE